MFSKYLYKIKVDKFSGIRSHGVLSLTGFLSFNRQDHRGNGYGHLLSKELVCVV